MDEYLIKQINLDLSKHYEQSTYNYQTINHTITLIRNGYSTDTSYLNEDQLLSILCDRALTDEDNVFHTDRLAKIVYQFNDSKHHIVFNDLPSAEKEQYHTLVHVVANQLNDNSLLSRIKRVGNQFIYISSKMQQQKF